MSGMTGKLTEIREFDRELAHSKGNIATFAMSLPPLMAGKYIFISILYYVIATTATISLKIIRKKEIEKFLKTSGSGGNNLKPLFSLGKRVTHRPFPSSPLSTYSAEFSMPLPSVTKHNAPQCTAMSKRSRERCRNPAAYGCRTCRIHGARRPESIKSGSAHPNYKHGLETLPAKRQRSIKLAELRVIENDLLARGLIKGKRTAGRKPVI